jgi:hypothetical protein
MRVSDIAVVPYEDSWQLQGWVESDRALDDGNRFEPFLLWYRFPGWCRPYLNEENGDPFLAALLVPAMMSGERLAIDAPISRRLLRSLPDLQAIYHCFDPRMKIVTVEATTRQSLLETSPPANGLFFSLGVDSYYSLLKNRRDHPTDDQSVSHLVMIHGMDVYREGWDERFSSRMRSAGERAARELGKEFLPVITNMRVATRTTSRWSMSHGSALASVALALHGLFAQVRIAATTTYDLLYPWGSHPVLDPHWSTESMTIIHDGCETGRIDKVAFIAASSLVLETLKVCPYYNCGKCLKCLPTIIDLLGCGALEQCTTLPHTVDIAALREVFRAYKGTLNSENYQRRLDLLEARDALPEVRNAFAEFLAEHPADPT